MPQINHRLVGVVELSTACDFEAVEFQRDHLLDDGPLPTALTEATLRADVSNLSSELEKEYQQFFASGKNHELAVL